MLQRQYFANKGSYSQSYGFSSNHVWMGELDHKEGWDVNNWCFLIVVLEKTLESFLDYKEIQPVHPKGNQSWISIGRTDAETSIFPSNRAFSNESVLHIRWPKDWSFSFSISPSNEYLRLISFRAGLENEKEFPRKGRKWILGRKESRRTRSHFPNHWV